MRDGAGDMVGSDNGPRPRSATTVRPAAEADAEVVAHIDERHRGRGVGRQLVGALLATAADRGYWKLLSRVFPFNEGSRALCRSMGFREVGVYQKHAQLEGRWLDVVIVEKLISENQK